MTNMSRDQLIRKMEQANVPGAKIIAHHLKRSLADLDEGDSKAFTELKLVNVPAMFDDFARLRIG